MLRSVLTSLWWDNKCTTNKNKRFNYSFTLFILLSVSDSVSSQDKPDWKRLNELVKKSRTLPGLSGPHTSSLTIVGLSTVIHSSVVVMNRTRLSLLILLFNYCTIIPTLARQNRHFSDCRRRRWAPSCWWLAEDEGNERQPRQTSNEGQTDRHCRPTGPTMSAYIEAYIATVGGFSGFPDKNVSTKIQGNAGKN